LWLQEVLNQSVMGTRLYVAGPESFMGLVMRIARQFNLNKDEVDRMVRDAETYAAADKAKKEEAEIRNTASSLIYSTEKSLKEVGDKAEAGVRGDVETALTELKQISEEFNPSSNSNN